VECQSQAVRRRRLRTGFRAPLCSFVVRKVFGVVSAGSHGRRLEKVGKVGCGSA
jgi:hypothetical protein